VAANTAAGTPCCGAGDRLYRKRLPDDNGIS
jgi:hypothetical protein